MASSSVHHMEIQDNGKVLQYSPRFIKFLSPKQCEYDRIKMPDTFIAEYGDLIPFEARLQFINGREFNVHYEENENSLSHVGSMLKEFKDSYGLLCVFSYNGDGNFLVSSLNDNLTEVVYGVPTSGAIAHVYPQDTMNDVGWQFISRSIGQIFKDGGAGIPRSFINRFGDIIPTSVKFALNSGEVLHGSYSKHSRKLYDFLPIIQKKYLQQFDIILFTYCRNGRFEVCIFDRSKVEKYFSMDLVLIEYDSEESDSEDSDSEEKTEGEGHDSELALEPYDQDLVDMTGQFAAAMLRSNIDHTTHGVYIPAYVTPNNRGWRCCEKVVLRTTTGEWTLGLVISNEGPRFSAGWNRFARENALKMNDILYFNLVEDDEVVVFEVEIQEDN